MYNFNTPYGAPHVGPGMMLDPLRNSPAANQFRMALANIQAQLSHVLLQMTMPETPDIARHSLHQQRTALLNQLDEVVDQQTAFWKANFAQPGGPQYRTAGQTPVPAWANPWNPSPSWGGMPHVPPEFVSRQAPVPPFAPHPPNPRWDPSVIDTTAREVRGDQG